MAIGKSKVRNEFDRKIKRFVDNGYVKILYQNNDFAVCNYCNQCYLLFPFDFWLDAHGNQYAIAVHPTNLVPLITEYLSMMKQYIDWPDEVFIKHTIVFDDGDDMFEHARLTKENTDKNGPSKNIDFEIEEFVLKHLSKK